MLPLGSISTPVALLHAVMPGGKVAQFSTSVYDDPFASAARTPAGLVLMSATTTATRAARITPFLLRRSPDRPSPLRCLAQLDLLRAPVPHFADDQIVFGAAVDRVDHAELFGQLAGLAKTADHLAVQLNLVDLAVVHAFGIVRV